LQLTEALIDLVGYAGMALMAIGAFCSLVASIGMNRFPNFFVRLHAASVGTIGGAFVPMIGASLLAFTLEELGSYRFFIGGAGIVAAFFLLILAPAGSHILARAAYLSKAAEVYPKVVDKLEEDLRGGQQ